MQYLRQEENTDQEQEWTAGSTLLEGLDSAAMISPEVEDARRRFVLALRSMTARREREERDAAVIRQSMKTLEADVAAYRKSKQRKLRRQLFIAGIVGVVLLSKNVPALHGFGDWWWFFLFGAGGTAAAQAGDMRRSRQLAHQLAIARDPRAVSVLVVAARDGDPDTQRIAIQGLTSILPQLRASDADAVTEQGMNALLNLLGRTADMTLQVAILRALEQVGDERAISIVEMLADPQENASVYEAARSCLGFLRSRAEQARMRNTLLRPAAASVEPDRTLLRPAASSETPADQLLRPADS
jgi:hypothetical protein